MSEELLTRVAETMFAFHALDLLDAPLKCLGAARAQREPESPESQREPENPAQRAASSAKLISSRQSRKFLQSAR